MTLLALILHPWRNKRYNRRWLTYRQRVREHAIVYNCCAIVDLITLHTVLL